jgi:putative ABC transport system permease protein
MNSRWLAAVRRHARNHGVELPLVVQEELAAHLEDTYLHAIRLGATEDSAQQQALQTLAAADLTAFKTSRRADPQRQSRFHGIEFDVRYALRLLYRSPLFAVSVATVLAISIGATCAAFSVVDAVLLRPLPYSDPGRLAMLTRVDKNGTTGAMAAADWSDYATRVASVSGVAAYSNWTHNLSGGEPLRLRSIITTGNFFGVLGSTAHIGRTFDENDDRPNAPPVVVLSDGLWQRRFGGDRGAVGRTVTLNGRVATIIGVMPRAFAYPSRDVDLWMPIAMSPELRSDRASEWLQTIARLSPDTSIDGASADLRALAAALAETYPQTNANESAVLVPLLDHVVGRVRPAVLVVSAAVLFVFLVTCLTVANLLLARASTRQQEMAIRMAMGADRWRLARQVLAESAVLTTLAGLAGLALSWVIVRTLSTMAASRIPRLEEVSIEWTTMLVVTAAGAVVLACCGLIATKTFARGTEDPLLRSGARVIRPTRLRPVLVTIQIAVSFVLVTAALLLGASYAQIERVTAGFNTDDVLSLRITLPRQQYADGAAHARFADAVVEAVSATPGVTAAGVVNDLPFAGNQMSFAVAREGIAAEPGPPPRATVRFASPGYFTTLQVPVITGRVLTSEDRADRERVVVVNESAARQYWSGDAIGKRVRIGESQDWRRIVGVVADSRHAGLQRDEGPVVYAPYAQKPFDFINWMGVLVRAPAATTVVRAVKAQLQRVDPIQPVYDVMLLDDYLARERAPYRLNSWLVGALAALSLALAVAGVFALVAYDAAARQREFGVRLALGATGASVLRLILLNTLRLVATGALLGAIAAMFAVQSLTAILYDITPTDPRVFAAVAIGMLSAALLAALGPALRAAHTDPVSTLRTD